MKNYKTTTSTHQSLYQPKAFTSKKLPRLTPSLVENLFSQATSLNPRTSNTSDRNIHLITSDRQLDGNKH